MFRRLGGDFWVVFRAGRGHECISSGWGYCGDTETGERQPPAGEWGERAWFTSTCLVALVVCDQTFIWGWGSARGQHWR